MSMRKGSLHDLPSWAIVFTVMMACMWAGNQFTPLLLMYKQNHGYGDLEVSIFFGAYVFGLVPALLVGAKLSDKFGRRPMLAAGLGAAILCSLCMMVGTWSASALIAGRMLAGIGVGIATAVGSSWTKELSQAPYDMDAGPSSGPRRAALAVTLGSLLAATAAGSIAQFTDLGEILPYLLHIAVCLPGVLLLHRVPDTAGVQPTNRAERVPAGSTRDQRRSRKSFIITVITAPWLFIAAGVAYAYLPVLLGDQTGIWGLGYATLLSTVTLSVAAYFQTLTKRFRRLRDSGIPISMAIFAVGFAAVALSDQMQDVLIGLFASAIVGVGFGIGLVSGLAAAQRDAEPKSLATRTGTFYALAFSGFLAPTLISFAGNILPIPWLLGILGITSALLGLTAWFCGNSSPPASRQDKFRDLVQPLNIRGTHRRRDEAAESQPAVGSNPKMEVPCRRAGA